MIRLCQICKNELLPSQKRFCSKPCYGRYLKDNPEARNHFKNGAKAWNKGLKGYLAGTNHWHWRGGRRKHSHGYIEIYYPGHPYSRHGGYVYEHRFVMEKMIKRFLYPWERIHHINGITNDNRPENLKLFSNDSDHSKYHWKLKKTTGSWQLPSTDLVEPKKEHS